MNEDRLQEKFADGFIKGATQIGALIAFFIFSAAATATDPFFRKNMGERYFTSPRAVVSLIGWLVMFFVAKTSNNIGMDLYGNITPPNHLVKAVGIVILLAYGVMAGYNLYTTYQRRRTGLYWHSKSRGESVFGYESKIRDLLVEVLVFVGLMYVSKIYGAFFLLSRLMGYAAEAAGNAAFYNRYLDIMDAKIEAENMEAALRDGLVPSKVGGFDRRLPAGYTTEQRANIARVVTGGPIIAPIKNEPTKTATANVEVPKSAVAAS